MAERTHFLHAFLNKYLKWIIIGLVLLVVVMVTVAISTQRADTKASEAMKELTSTDENFNLFLLQTIAAQESDELASLENTLSEIGSDLNTETEDTTDSSEDILYPTLKDDLLSIVENYPDTFAQHLAQFRLAYYYWYNDDSDKALEYFLASSNYKNSYMLPIVFLNLAAVYEELEETELSKNSYQRIIDNYKTHPAYPEALFNLGRINEGINFDGADLAKGYYQSILDDELWSESQWADLAKSRILQFEIADESNSEES